MHAQREKSNLLQFLAALTQNPSRNLAHEFVKITRVNISKERPFFLGQVEHFAIETLFNGALWIAHEQRAKVLVDDAGTHETIQIGLVHTGLR